MLPNGPHRSKLAAHTTEPSHRTTPPAASLARDASATCGRNLNLSFSASIRCSELSGITRPKAECIFVYVKDKQMNKVDFPTRTQMPPFSQAFGREGGCRRVKEEGRLCLLGITYTTITLHNVREEFLILKLRRV